MTNKSEMNEKKLMPQKTSQIFINQFFDKVTLMKQNKFLLFSIILMKTDFLFAERGMDVDVDGFISSFSASVIRVGNATSIAGFVLVCIGLMIPGFRDYTKRALPWTIAGIVGIIFATRYWT